MLINMASGQPQYPAAGNKPYRGRLAPSPTGYLHMGHARTFWLAHERAVAAGGTLVVRNEDLDKERAKPEYVQGFLEDLSWFGISWSEGPDVGGPYGPYSQSQRLSLYQQAFEKLNDAGYLYPCTCSRRDIMAALSAPHQGDEEPVYPGTCRHKKQQDIWSGTGAVLVPSPVHPQTPAPPPTTLSTSSGDSASSADSSSYADITSFGSTLAAGASGTLDTGSTASSARLASRSELRSASGAAASMGGGSNMAGMPSAVTAMDPSTPPPRMIAIATNRQQQQQQQQLVHAASNTSLQSLDSEPACRKVHKASQSSRPSRGGPHTNTRPSSPFAKGQQSMTPKVAWRFRVPDGEAVEFTDGFMGLQKFVANKDFGDFVVWRQDGLPSYQLACVVDDAAMGVTEVVRGCDLLMSTARQLLLYRALKLEPPAWFHCPLVLDDNGVRLAKRHDALSLRKLRESRATPEQLRAAWSSISIGGKQQP